MRQARILFLIGLILLQPVKLVSAQDTIAITSLSAGEAIRGVVSITGITATEGFLFWELTFGYAGDTTGTWFLLDEGEGPIEDGILTEWDTTTITDGTYNLRLTVNLEEGRRTHFIIPDLRVRNYTVIETITPTPTLTLTPFTLTPEPTTTLTATVPPTETPIPNTPTPLPTNPVEISNADVSSSLVRGVAGVFAAFLIVGVYTSIKRSVRK